MELITYSRQYHPQYFVLQQRYLAPIYCSCKLQPSPREQGEMGVVGNHISGCQSCNPDSLRYNLNRVIGLV